MAGFRWVTWTQKSGSSDRFGHAARALHWVQKRTIIVDHRSGAGKGQAMNDWFNVVEDSRYRRDTFLAEANQNRRLAVLHDDGVRGATAELLIKVAVWLAPASSPRRAVLSDERVLPRVARI